MINIVMLVKDRPRLTEQALSTLVATTDSPYTLTIIDDRSQPETRDLLRIFCRNRDNVALLRNETSKGITGQARNLGIYWSDRYFGRGDWLYLSDNDVVFQPDWDKILTVAYKNLEADREGSLRVLGGCRHPFHQPTSYLTDGSHQVQIVDAVAGYSQLIRWWVWDKFGPLDAHAPGICNSEDFKFCQEIVRAGGRVGYIHPAVVIDCGLTTTDGKPAVGAEAKPRVEGFYYE